MQSAAWFFIIPVSCCCVSADVGGTEPLRRNGEGSPLMLAPAVTAVERVVA